MNLPFEAFLNNTIFTFFTYFFTGQKRVVNKSQNPGMITKHWECDCKKQSLPSEVDDCHTAKTNYQTENTSNALMPKIFANGIEVQRNSMNPNCHDTDLSTEVKLEVKEEVDDELRNGFEVLDTMTFDFQF